MKAVRPQPVRRARVSELDLAAARIARKAHRDAVRDLERRRALAGHNAHAAQAYRGALGPVACGALARTTGEGCRRPGIGAGGRCRLHGGASRKLTEGQRGFLHAYFAEHGRRGAAMRWARVRAAGGLSRAMRAFLAECRRDAWRRAKGER